MKNTFLGGMKDGASWGFESGCPRMVVLCIYAMISSVFSVHVKSWIVAKKLPSSSVSD